MGSGQWAVGSVMMSYGSKGVLRSFDSSEEL